MGEIKNIIFDLGGVLLNIDYNKTAVAAEQLGITNFQEMYSQVNADSLFENLETGVISETVFYETIKKRIPHTVSNQQIAEVWNAMLLDFRKDSLAFLGPLSSKYKLYLLSNTNSIHLSRFHEILARETGLPSLDRYFTKTYYSNLIGLRKPGKEVFYYVLKDGNMTPGETLFIDDTVLNIESAAAIGIRTWLLRPGEKIEDIPALNN